MYRFAAVALFGAAFVLISTPAVAQHDHDHDARREGAAREDAHHGYTDFQDRDIKALSPEDVEALLSAHGLGFALAAELNGYPGPRHVLDLADELGLTEAQQETVTAIQARMREAALGLGERLVAAERALDRAFAEGGITAEEVDARSEEIGRLKGRLRAVHLKAHLETTALLQTEQIARYEEARGYHRGSRRQ